ncbi:Hypothetical Protein FCC1311_041072 [Hondaea fermentalgiana]|uniref:Uncharacterized protein n=1 Tax=Hondaea fermentalgiana TaxID=2315210 RepID=A0A2R5GJ45_9STRA|nr:Hypothetical Protein FCC1311_041072 [Hondaea fermentalgiana]|eukprot:GBG27884.1 Hypothetical Protein FCC1311_041072 [Hondaea fermentalgiana]
MRAPQVLLALVVAALACATQGLETELATFEEELQLKRYPPKDDDDDWDKPKPPGGRPRPPKPDKNLCSFKCPKYSKVKSKVNCCHNIYDCQCKKGYRRVAHKGICVPRTERPEPTTKPVRCPYGIKKKKCCCGDPCYEKKFGGGKETFLEELDLEFDDDDIVDDNSPDVEKDEDDDDDDDDDEETIEEGELVPYDEMLEESEEEETGVSLRASIMDFLQQEDQGWCGPHSIVCAKGTKPCYKNDCPRNQQKDCCCKCKGGRMKSNGKCRCPAKPTPAPTPEPKQCRKHHCEDKPNTRVYLTKSNKCKCKCKKGFEKKYGECKPKMCFYKTSCKKGDKPVWD